MRVSVPSAPPCVCVCRALARSCGGRRGGRGRLWLAGAVFPCFTSTTVCVCALSGASASVANGAGVDLNYRRDLLVPSIDSDVVLLSSC